MTAVYAITGHRPGKLGGYTDETQLRLLRLFRWFFAANRPDSIVCGMALGVDLAACQVAIDMGISVIAAVPYEEQDHLWSTDDKVRYRALLGMCTAVHIIGTFRDGSQIFHRRNEWMVDHCTHIVAVWNGKPTGGTAQCMTYGAPLRPHWNLYESLAHV